MSAIRDMWPDDVYQRADIAEAALGLLRSAGLLDGWEAGLAEYLAVEVFPDVQSWRWEHAVTSAIAWSRTYYDTGENAFEGWGPREWTALLLLLMIEASRYLAEHLSATAIFGEMRGPGCSDGAIAAIRRVVRASGKEGE